MSEHLERAAKKYAADYDNDWETMSVVDQAFALMSVEKYIEAFIGDRTLYEFTALGWDRPPEFVTNKRGLAVGRLDKVVVSDESRE